MLQAIGRTQTGAQPAKITTQGKAGLIINYPIKPQELLHTRRLPEIIKQSAIEPIKLSAIEPEDSPKDSVTDLVMTDQPPLPPQQLVQIPSHKSQHSLHHKPKNPY